MTCRFFSLAATLCAVVLIVACGGNTAPNATTSAPGAPVGSATAAPTSAPPAPATATVNIFDSSFGAPVTIAIRGTVTWVNADSDDHDVVTTDRSFASPMLTPGGTFTRSFAQAGTFSYFCSTHPAMKGAVTVR